MIDTELEYMRFKREKAKEAIERLKGLQKSHDTENAHIEADDILCELVAAYVSSEVVEEWEKVRKWYAQNLWNKPQELSQTLNVQKLQKIFQKGIDFFFLWVYNKVTR